MNSTRPITTILFDAGGTLIHLDYGFLQRVLRRAGISVTQQALREGEGAARTTVDQRMLAAETDTDETRRHPYFISLFTHLGLKKAKIDQVLDFLETEHKRHNLWRVMRPSTPQVLSNLRAQGLQLGVVSNSDGRIFSILDRCGIANFFQVIVDSHDVGVEKPDPRIFQFALDKLQARPEQTIYVGDIYSIDIVGAERARLQPVLIDGVGCYATTQCRKIRHLRSLLSIVS